jgi:phospholipid/cholesterol/gamma-HCH transport system substrate-binding protein
VRFSDIPRGSSQKVGMSPVRAGILALVVLALFAFFGFSKLNPFSNKYELNAVFSKANRIKPRSPVRISGVNVGKVVKVEALEDGSGLSRVKMEIENQGLPIRRDATATIRSRLFLEGNYFVDVHPGRPGSPEMHSGSTIPVGQTAAPVQFAQILTALQSDTREDLQRFLHEYSEALRGKGAAGFNQAIKHWEEAYKKTSQVSEATLGIQAHDLNRVLKGQGRVFGALSSNEQTLEDLVTDLNDTVSGFARQEDNLRNAIPALRDVVRDGRPALASLDRALPQVRGFARDALPGARSSSPTLDAQLPFIKQARRLVARSELGGLARRLRQTVPHLTRLNKGTRLTLAENRALASCQNRVLVPFARTPIPDPSFPNHTNEPWFEEAGRGFVGLSGESRIADANGPMFRVEIGGGPTTIVNAGDTVGGPLYGQLLVPLDGVRPIRPTRRPVFRPGVPCETQEPPNMNAPAGGASAVGTQTRARATRPPTARQRRMRARAYALLREYQRRKSQGKDAPDPLLWPREKEKPELKRLGLERLDSGRLVERKKR